MYARACLLALAIASPVALAEGIYTWKDENGRVHFSDKAPTSKAKEVALPTRQGERFSASQLVGTWSIEASRNGVAMRTTFSLNADGSFSGGGEANGKPFMTYAGKWELVGDRINWLYTEVSVPLPEEAKKDSDKVLSISPTRIEVLSLRSGEKRTMVRM